MAKVGNNLVTSKLSGKLGDEIVFRVRGGKTFVSAAPAKSNKEITQQQIDHRHHFQEAVIYGKSSYANPAIRSDYQAAAKENQSAFNVAVADFMQAPHIDEIDLSNYSGHSGENIRIRAVDDFKVVSATVSIFNADSSLLEEGIAVQQDNGIDWLYTTTSENGNLAGDKIVVRVSDLPGNSTTSEKTI
jgi:hypothetical protein